VSADKSASRTGLAAAACAGHADFRARILARMSARKSVSVSVSVSESVPWNLSFKKLLTHSTNSEHFVELYSVRTVTTDTLIHV